MARHLCTSFADPLIVAPLLTCRLIKNPGIRLIGVGEVVRRIIAKAVISIIGTDIQQATDPLQLCAGYISGAEAAIYSMNTVYADEKAEGVLVADASNAFN